MKIAFATTDMTHIDDHFGKAACFAIYEVDQSGFSFLQIMEFNNNDLQDKIIYKIEALSDCSIVYSASIGGTAAAKLIKKGVFPMKSKGVQAIEDTLDRLKTALNNNPAPWLRKIMVRDINREMKEV